MNGGSRHPDDDRDLNLARYLGDRLDKGGLDDRAPNAGALSEDDAGLLRAALRLRGREAPSEEASVRMWERIDEATQAPVGGSDRGARRRPAAERGSARPAVIHRLRPWMAAAAAILIGAVATLLILQTPEPTLVAAAKDQAVEFVGDDGSIILLRPHSELYLVEASTAAVRYRLEGEAFFTVTERATQVFAVEAADAVVEVLGTRFNLSTWGETASVYLEEGRIRFAYAGADVILEPGQWSRITEVGLPLPPTAEPADEHLDWIDGEIRFDQERAALIVAEIEHHFDIEIALPAAIAAETLSGRILLDDRQQSLEDLGQVLGGRFVEIDDHAYQFASE